MKSLSQTNKSGKSPPKGPALKGEPFAKVASLTIGETVAAPVAAPKAVQVTPVAAPALPPAITPKATQVAPLASASTPAPVDAVAVVAEFVLAPPNLADLEQVIASGLRTFVDVGQALTRIRDGELYKATHASFEAYCSARWDFSRARAYQFISASAVVENVNNCRQPLPAVAHESQARELAKLPPKEQPKAWAAAVKTAPNGLITAQHVAKVVTARLPDPKPKAKPKPGKPEAPVALLVAPLDPEAALAQELDSIMLEWRLGGDRFVELVMASAQRARAHFGLRGAANG